MAVYLPAAQCDRPYLQQLLKTLSSPEGLAMP
jgi:hypothetical protein